jgi:hypothetical protein
VKSLQNSYVFVASFVLGASMAWGPGPGTRSVGVRAALAVVGVRFLVLPLLGCVIVVGSIKLGWYDPPNPVFVFLLLLQYSVPTSNQIQNMASMFQNHEKEIGARSSHVPVRSAALADSGPLQTRPPSPPFFCRSPDLLGVHDCHAGHSRLVRPSLQPCGALLHVCCQSALQLLGLCCCPRAGARSAAVQPGVCCFSPAFCAAPFQPPAG